MERMAPAVFAAKAGDFNLVSLIGIVCPRYPAKPRSPSISGAHGILQRAARLEHRNRRSGDRQGLAGPWVARGPGRPVPGAERAESEYPRLFAIRQGLADRLEHAVDCILCGGLAHSRPACQALRQFRLVHPCAPVFDKSIRVPN